MASEVIIDKIYSISEIFPELDKRVLQLGVGLLQLRSEAAVVAERIQGSLVQKIFEISGQIEQKMERQNELLGQLDGLAMKASEEKGQVDDSAYQATHAQRGSVVGQLQRTEQELDGLERQRRQLIGEQKPVIEAEGSDVPLEQALRRLDLTWLEENAGSLKQTLPIIENLTSIIRDMQRPLVQFLINGKEVMDRSGALDGKAILEQFARALAGYQLSVRDLYVLLEFFHQGGTAEGAKELTAIYKNEFSVRALGPVAYVQAEIDRNQLRRITSVAKCEIVNTDEEKVGEKTCSTVYDFLRGEVRLSIA
jgi:hypothetical protein